MRWRSTSHLVALVFLLAAAGCVPFRDDRVDMQAKDLVGVWTSTNGRSLTFEEDGRFVASGIPHQLLERFTGVLPLGFDPDRDRLDGAGQWLLESALSDPDGPRNSIHLGLRELSGRPTSGGLDLNVERQESTVVLAFYIGDPDLNNRIVYQKCAVPCAAGSPAPTRTG